MKQFFELEASYNLNSTAKNAKDAELPNPISCLAWRSWRPWRLDLLSAFDSQPGNHAVDDWGGPVGDERRPQRYDRAGEYIHRVVGV